MIIFDHDGGNSKRPDDFACVYTGPIDSNEELSGKECKFKFEDQNMIYTGEMQENTFEGQGQIDHTDTGNLFKGQFHNGCKHGKVEFQPADYKNGRIDAAALAYDKEKLESGQKNG